MYLREHNSVALHIACGEITDVEILNDVFVINTTESYIIELLNDKTNYQDLKKAFEYFKISNFEIRKKQKQTELIENDLKILKNYFSEIVIEEGEK